MVPNWEREDIDLMVELPKKRTPDTSHIDMYGDRIDLTLGIVPNSQISYLAVVGKPPT